VEQILQLRNRTADLEQIAAALRNFVARQLLSDAIAAEMQLVLEEAFTNIVKYAYADGRDDHPVTVHLDATAEWLEMELIDGGMPFDPFAQAVDQLHRPFEERSDGLMGVPLIKALVDEYVYARRDGRNHVTLRKRLKAGRADPGLPV
jgi:anti-sigma regulatory factor (Ser/Thr protein kinase)